MEFSEYGNKDGQLVVYFHGTPGSPEEFAPFDAHAKKHNLRVICLDRYTLCKSIRDSHSYYQRIADQIRAVADGAPINLIGFSIGASVALEVGKLLDDHIRQTHLISAGAPIAAGDFIDHMAGGLIFRLAMNRPRIFNFVTQYQKLIALLAPKLLFKMLFASAAGEDKTLIGQKDFRRYIIPILKHSFGENTEGYIRDINLYVTWPGELEQYQNSVSLWHGTADNWSPISMATHLRDNMAGTTRVETFDGLSHYSCLWIAAPVICAALEQS